MLARFGLGSRGRSIAFLITRYWRALRPASKSGAVMILASARADHYRPVRTFIASGTTYADCMADVVAQLAEGEELVSVEALLDE